MALPLIPWSKTPLASARRSIDAALPVQQTALDLYVLGYPDLAKKLLDTLYDAYQGLEFNIQKFDTAQALLYAWDASSDLKPAFLTDRKPNIILKGQAMDREGVRKSQESAQKWEDGLPQEMRGKHEKGGFTKEDSEWALKHIKEGFNCDLSIGVAVQIAAQSDDRTTANKIILDNVWKVYAHLSDHWNKPEVTGAELRQHVQDRLELHCSPAFWTAIPGKSYVEDLKIDEEVLHKFVNEGCELTKKRFTQGPARPYADKSTAELLHIMDENYIAARKANPEAGEHMSVLDLETWPNQPTTFLQPGATASQISACEERLSQPTTPNDSNDTPEILLPDGELPKDYKGFLRLTNGFQVESSDPTGIFCSIDEIATSDVSHLKDMDFTLFPYEFTSPTNINNIPLNEYTCFSIGSGGDEGEVVLVPPSSVKVFLADFEKAYETASEVEKKMYERAAVDLYGGLEKMRGMHWMCMVWYHWSPEQRVWGGFREYLEECVGYAVERRRKDEKEAKEKEGKKESEKKELKRASSSEGNVRMDTGDDEGARYNLRDRKSQRTT